MATPGRRGLAAALIGVACLAALLHAANLLHLARAHGCASLELACLGAVGLSATRDTQSYLEVAAEIRERGILGASYRRRPPGYPLLLVASERLTGSPSAALWLAPPLAGAAAAAIAWLAGLLAGRTRAALTAGLLFCAWPNAYQLAPLLMTDALHGFLAVAALACTLAWRKREGASAAALAAALWGAAQSLRPTFFPVALALPVLLAKRGAAGRYWRLSAALWGATCLVPAFVIGSNSSRAQPGEMEFPIASLACYTLPRLKQDLGLGHFDRLRVQCWQRYEKDPWRQARRDLGFLLAHKSDTLASFAREVSHQLSFPHSPFYHRKLAPLYPAWSAMQPRSAVAFWLCAAAGLALVARRRPAVGLFLLLCFALVMGPAAATARVGARIRFPIDLFAISLVAVLAEELLARARRLRDRLRAGRPLSGEAPSSGAGAP